VFDTAVENTHHGAVLFMKIAILGAGIAGISLAYFLQENSRVAEIRLFERARFSGGLCCSVDFAGIACDIGPHILFSRNRAILDLLLSILDGNVHKLKRCNKILHDGRFVKYPFENDLAALSTDERDYCLRTFLNNPYANYAPQNMLQFFLATFGEGITNLYLRPYNEKIWKFDPAFMDTQMVERIPKPPPADIIRSAKGIPTEGYVHQLYFYYPKRGGVQSLVRGFEARLESKVSIKTKADIQTVSKSGKKWLVSENGIVNEYDVLISTIPIPDLITRLRPLPPENVVEASTKLRYNSIAICLIHAALDQLGDNMTFTIANKNVVFHRLSKLDLFLPEEARDGTSRLMAEVTYHLGDSVSVMSDQELIDRVISDLVCINFIKRREQVKEKRLLRYKHAYVVYDLDHRQNTRILREYCEKENGIILHGRFGQFEYLNIDGVVERSLIRSKEIGGFGRVA
jgi:protoporphyrinogen oxidase